MKKAASEQHHFTIGRQRHPTILCSTAEKDPAGPVSLLFTTCCLYGTGQCGIQKSIHIHQWWDYKNRSALSSTQLASVTEQIRPHPQESNQRCIKCTSFWITYTTALNNFTTETKVCWATQQTVAKDNKLIHVQHACHHQHLSSLRNRLPTVFKQSLNWQYSPFAVNYLYA